MAAQSGVNAATAHTLNSIVSQMKAASAKLDADCTTTLCASDSGPADPVLQRLDELSSSLIERKAVKLDEAMFCLRETRICELLLSLLRRWPWAEMRQERAALHVGLSPLPEVLSSLYGFLCVAERVRSSQQAAAYAEMNNGAAFKRACAHLAAVKPFCSEVLNRPGKLLCCAARQ